MSFAEDFTLQLRADLARALALPAAAVYVGREPRRVARTGLEAWVQPLAVEEHRDQKAHHFEVHLRLKERRESELTGLGQLETLWDLLEALSRRYQGTRPFVPAVPALLGVEVEGTSVDQDPDSEDQLDGVLKLKAVEA